MKVMIDFDLPFPWCAVCEEFDPAVVQYYGDYKAGALRCCQHADFCQAADKARKSHHLGSIYKADPKHGIVEHKVNQIVTIYHTDARAEDGETWADQFTEDEIMKGKGFETASGAAAAVQRATEDQSRA